jgi:hypothetical protein
VSIFMTGCAVCISVYVHSWCISTPLGVFHLHQAGRVCIFMCILISVLAGARLYLRAYLPLHWAVCVCAYVDLLVYIYT